MNTYDEEYDGRVVRVKYKRGRKTDQLTLPKKHRRASEQKRERDKGRGRDTDRDRNR